MMAEKDEKPIKSDDGGVAVVNHAQFGLQGYDKGVISEKELGPAMGINLSTGGVTKEWNPLHYRQTMFQLYDRKLITEDLLRKQVFELEPKKEG